MDPSKDKIADTQESGDSAQSTSIFPKISVLNPMISTLKTTLGLLMGNKNGSGSSTNQPVTVAHHVNIQPVTVAQHSSNSQPVAVGHYSNSQPVTVTHQGNSQPLTVTHQGNSQPVTVTHQGNSQPVTVAHHSNSQPVTVAHHVNIQPVTVAHHSNSQPLTVTHQGNSHPVTVAHHSNSQPLTVAHHSNSQPLTVTHQGNSQPVTLAHHSNSQPLTVTHQGNSQPVTVTHQGNSQPVTVTQPNVDTQNLECFGSILSNITGAGNCKAKVSNYEVVNLKREPNNAVRVENLSSEKVGQLGRGSSDAKAFSQIMNGQLAKLEAQIPYGAKNRGRIPLRIHIWGAPDKKDQVLAILGQHHLALQAPMTNVVRHQPPKKIETEKKNKKDAKKKHKVLKQERTNKDIFDGVVDLTNDLAGVSEDEPIDVDNMNKDDAEGVAAQNLVCFGSIESALVGMEYCKKKVSNGEVVTLEREPNNPCDRNAVKVVNFGSEKVGLIRREDARTVAQIMDGKLATVEGKIPRGANNKFRVPLHLNFSGTPDKKDEVLAILRQHGLVVRSPVTILTHQQGEKKNKKDAKKKHKMPMLERTLNKDFFDSVINMTNDLAGVLEDVPVNVDEMDDVADMVAAHNLVCFGSVESALVGMQYYKKKVSNGEMVTLEREPNNLYDRNAVKVENLGSEKVGHIKREDAIAVAQIMDGQLAKLEGKIPYGAKNKFRIPLHINFWGAPDKKDQVLAILRQHGLVARAPQPGQKPNVDFDVLSSSAGMSSAMDYGHVMSSRTFVSPQEMQTEMDKMFETLEEGDKTTEAEPAKAIVRKLYPHQKQALNWMMCKENKNDLPPFWKETKTLYVNSLTRKMTKERPASVRGGILADDMGLGKTLEMISLIMTNAADGKPLAEPIPNLCRDPLENREQDTLNAPYNGDAETKMTGQEILGENISSSSAISNQQHQPCEKTSTDYDGAIIKTSDVQEAVAAELRRMVKRPAEPAVEDGGDQDVQLPASKKVKMEDQTAENGTDRHDVSNTCQPTSSHTDMSSAPKGDDEEISTKTPCKLEEEKTPSSSASPLMRLKSILAQKSKQQPTPPSSKLSSDVVVIDDDDELPDIPSSVVVEDSDDGLPEIVGASPPSCSSEVKVNGADLSVGTVVDVNCQTRADNSIPFGTRGTLIICPPSVVNNWQTQFLEHVDKTACFNLMVYYGPKRSRDITLLKEQDVVITCYSTVASDFKSKHGSPLHRVNWLRLVLDEGHYIRNPAANMTKAIYELKAERRWVLTGTPIQNSLKDLWSLMNFLQVKPFTEKRWWNNTIARPIGRGEKSALSRVAHLVGNLSLRRTKNQQLQGKPIIELPARHVYLEKISFSQEERQGYDVMQQEGRVIISRYFRQGTLLHHYGQVLAILMRLRQLCCHPRLVAQAVKKAMEKQQASAIEFGIDIDDQNDTSTQDKDLSEAERQSLIQQLMTIMMSGSDEECPICLDSLKNATITFCAHIYCKACIEDVIETERPDPKCPLCRRGLDKNKLIEAPEETEKRHKDWDGCEIEDVPDPDDWQSSAKVDALMKALTELRQQDPSVKSIVVSQFTSLLSLIEIPLAMEGFTYTRLDGTMNVQDRQEAIDDFSSQSPDSPTIMLLSLKAGGVGINLTAASRVFLMDPAWNPAAEEQCFDRCHRLGQTKDVVITRFVIEDSVEERMLELQEKKKQLMQAAFYKKPTAEQRRANMIDTIRRLINI